MKHLFSITPPLGLLALAAVARAQNPVVYNPAPSREIASANYVYSARSSYDDGARDVGKVGVQHTDFVVNWSVPAGERLRVGIGIAHTYNRLDADAGVVLPDQLMQLSAAVRLSYKFSDDWNGFVSAQPGYYSDFEHLSGDDFNVPVLAAASWNQSADLSWPFGVRFNSFADNAIIPIIGVRWRFAPRWQLTVGYPRIGVSYALTNSLNMHTGVSMDGGSYHLSQSLGRPARSQGELSDTYVDYRDVRVGLGADYKVGKLFILRAEVGANVAREFDYYERGYRLKGDAGLYAKIGTAVAF